MSAVSSLSRRDRLGLLLSSSLTANLSGLAAHSCVSAPGGSLQEFDRRRGSVPTGINRGLKDIIKDILKNHRHSASSLLVRCP
ncbi:hypothetical protein BGZ94_001667 [Podila epigama]|nr:hypothetical protein BGZ94_001667 [Podila epigama]